MFERNFIRVLPPSLGNLTNLRNLLIDDNPIVFPSEKILKLKTEKILEYLRKSQTKGENYNRRCKLVFVGTRGSGKTCLINSLRSNQKGVEWSEPDTKALSIEEWVLTRNEFIEPENDSSDDDFYQNINFDYEEKDLIRFTLWDFDERSFFAPLFVTDRSIFVYVWNMKADINFENFNYWMQIIKWKAPNSPVLVVGTHCDTHCFTNDALKDYQQYYPIKKFFEVSSKEGTSIENLRACIFKLADSLSFVNQPLDSSLVGFLNFLSSKKALGHALIDWKQLGVHMERYHLLPSDVQSFLEFASDLGEAFDFKTYLGESDFIFLDINFLIKVLTDVIGVGNRNSLFYFIILFYFLFFIYFYFIFIYFYFIFILFLFIFSEISDDGILEHEKLENEYGKDFGEKNTITKILQKLRVCFEIPKEKKSMVPSLLPRLYEKNIQNMQIKPQISSEGNSRRGTVKVFRFVQLFDSFFPQILCSNLFRQYCQVDKIYQNAAFLKHKTAHCLLVLSTPPLSHTTIRLLVLEGKTEDVLFLNEQVSFVISSFFFRYHGKCVKPLQILVPCFHCDHLFHIEKLYKRKLKNNAVLCDCEEQLELSLLLNEHVELLSFTFKSSHDNFFSSQLLQKEKFLLSQTLYLHHLKWTNYHFPLLFVPIPTYNGYEELDSSQWNEKSFKIYFLCEHIDQDSECNGWHFISESPFLNNPHNFFSLCGDYVAFLLRFLHTVYPDLVLPGCDLLKLSQAFTKKYTKDVSYIPEILNHQQFDSFFLRSITKNDFQEVGFSPSLEFYSQRTSFICEKHSMMKNKQFI